MNTEQQYAQAFNNGFLIAKYESAVFQTVSKNLSATNNYLGGFLDGGKQMEFEKEIVKTSELEQLRDKSISRERDFGRE